MQEYNSRKLYEENTLRKYINPTEEILTQRPIEEIQLDIKITIKELISRCSPTSNHRLEQTLIVLQQALSVNGLIPNDTAIFVHEQQQKQTEYLTLLTATHQQLGAVKWKLIKATREGAIPDFLTSILKTKKITSMNTYGTGQISEESTFNYTPIYKEEPAEIKVVPKTEYNIPPHEITSSLFITQAEKALHPYRLLKEKIKEEAYYCVTISDKDLLQIIVHQGTSGIKINIYKDTNNQLFIGKYYYIIALFDNLLEDEIAIKIDIWYEYIYIKGKKRKIGAYKGQYPIRKAKKFQIQKWKSMKEHDNARDADNTDPSLNTEDLLKPMK
ncbi:hypothetical protein C2G38_2211773 [Gigaspora rosea]|uniref:Uncharacterized protein n=1 Tax=Gigaspora rosea TaxID=44941 RepID=A0A397UH40_9GLOM|nr:hypothetical protein C2G38_2211773 [Gigaspora rosea]